MHTAASKPVTIHPDLHTVIIQFEIAAENSESFVRDLTEAVSKTIVKLPGFRTAVFQLSSDHTLVVNYAQWENAKTYERSMASIEPGDDLVRGVIAQHGARVEYMNAYDITASFSADA